MAAINMNGQQSFLLNDIKQHIRLGGNVSHILNVKVSREPSNEVVSRIRQHIFGIIQGNPITKLIHGMNVTITWRSTVTTSSDYYHADVGGMLGDVAVKRHTEMLLHDILLDLNSNFDDIFANGNTGLAFLISRPLVREIALVDENARDDEDGEMVERI